MVHRIDGSVLLLVGWAGVETWANVAAILVSSLRALGVTSVRRKGKYQVVAESVSWVCSSRHERQVDGKHRPEITFVYFENLGSGETDIERIAPTPA